MILCSIFCVLYILIYFNVRPTNAKELFNLRHASLRNAIERVFGVVKRRFPLMASSSEYNIHTQAKIPCALAALHNYIHIHDPEDDGDSEAEDYQDEHMSGADNNMEEDEPDPKSLGTHISNAEKQRASARRDQIAHDIWADYLCETREREG